MFKHLTRILIGANAVGSFAFGATYVTMFRAIFEPLLGATVPALVSVLVSVSGGLLVALLMDYSAVAWLSRSKDDDSTEEQLNISHNLHIFNIVMSTAGSIMAILALMDYQFQLMTDYNFALVAIGLALFIIAFAVNVLANVYYELNSEDHLTQRENAAIIAERKKRNQRHAIVRRKKNKKLQSKMLAIVDEIAEQQANDELAEFKSMYSVQPVPRDTVFDHEAQTISRTYEIHNDDLEPAPVNGQVGEDSPFSNR